MSDKKLTDSEIVKALECCCEARLNEDCKKLKCPFFDYEIDNCTNVGDMDAMYRFALNLINRQKAEIERLCVELDEVIIAKDLLFDEAEALIKKTKAEAYKEFAEKLKKKYKPYVILGSEVAEIEIYNLLKELVGDNNETKTF